MTELKDILANHQRYHPSFTGVADDCPFCAQQKLVKWLKENLMAHDEEGNWAEFSIDWEALLRGVGLT